MLCIDIKEYSQPVPRAPAAWRGVVVALLAGGAAACSHLEGDRNVAIGG